MEVLFHVAAGHEIYYVKLAVLIIKRILIIQSVIKYKKMNYLLAVGFIQSGPKIISYQNKSVIFLNYNLYLYFSFLYTFIFNLNSIWD